MTTPTTREACEGACDKAGWVWQSSVWVGNHPWHSLALAAILVLLVVWALVRLDR
ncbi:MAG: hypothetical protein QOD57_1403, partial [Actinomycetota bacterium]|nr:hypothetical protein [Actinomycetota bacterium]